MKIPMNLILQALKTELLTNSTKFCCLNRILLLLLIFPKIFVLFEIAIILD